MAGEDSTKADSFPHQLNVKTKGNSVSNTEVIIAAVHDAHLLLKVILCQLEG